MERQFIGKTAYIAQGRGQPLVLIHGVGMNAAIWAPQLAYFSARQRVIALELWGHGESALPPAATFADYHQQTTDLLDALQLGDVTLAGHSMGGLIAIAAALSRPQRVRRLVVLNAPYRRSDTARKTVLARAARVAKNNFVDIDEPIRRWFGAAPPAEQRENIQIISASLATINPQSYAVAYRIFADNDWRDDEQLSRLKIPALFMSGEEDKNSTMEMAQKMAASSGGKSFIIAKAGHMMPLTAAAAVNEALMNFITEQAVPAPENRPDTPT